MKDDGSITAAQATDAEAERLNFAAFARVRRDTGFHLVDEIGREARALAGLGSLTAQSYEVRSTIRPALQRATEAALQEGLAQYEQSAGRVEFRAPEANLSDAIRKLEARPQHRPQQAHLAHRARAGAAAALRRALDAGGRGREANLSRAPSRSASACATAACLPLSTFGGRTRARIGLYDVVYVKVIESTIRDQAEPAATQSGTRVELRVRPTVQGIAVVLENKTGRVLAMAGGFSYPLSQLNRVTQARRQPGSSFKPMTYLAALNSGLQPNTLVDDAPITYPPIGGATAIHAPRGLLVAAQLRRRLLRHDDDAPRAGACRRTSRRRACSTAASPASRARASTQICKLAIEAQVYPKCERYYPFVLGAQPVRPIDLAAFYAAIANEGKRPTPHVIEQITQDGREVYKANEGLRRSRRSTRRRCSSSARCCKAWWRAAPRRA